MRDGLGYSLHPHSSARRLLEYWMLSVRQTAMQTPSGGGSGRSSVFLQSPEERPESRQSVRPPAGLTVRASDTVIATSDCGLSRAPEACGVESPMNTVSQAILWVGLVSGLAGLVLLVINLNDAPGDVSDRAPRQSHGLRGRDSEGQHRRQWAALGLLLASVCCLVTVAITLTDIAGR